MASQSARTVWIEMCVKVHLVSSVAVSQSARTVWIEILQPAGSRTLCGRSQSARTVWIEIKLIGVDVSTALGHSLRGLCGLKLF